MNGGNSRESRQCLHWRYNWIGSVMIGCDWFMRYIPHEYIPHLVFMRASGLNEENDGVVD